MPQPLCDGVGVSLISLTVVNDMDVKQFFGMFWSLVPYAFLAMLIFGLFFTQRMSLFTLVVFGLIMTAINEFAVKNVHEESRPEHSCLDSGGFPSGHSMISVLYLTWLTLEFIIHPNWTWRKKTIGLIVIWCILAPCAPFRHVGGDHSWNQIAAGVVVGFILGLLLFLFNQFVIIRYLEYIMGWKITRASRIQNDLRPQYQHSKNKGAKAPSTTVEAFPSEQRIKSRAVFSIAHIIVIAINFILGALGIILGSVKNHVSECHPSSGVVAIGSGIWTFLAAIGMTIIFILSLRKLDNKPWAPELVQGLLFVTGFLIFESFFWNVAGVAVSHQDDDCYRGNLTLAYSILWFVVEVILLIFGFWMWFLLDLHHVYGFNKNCVPHPDGKVHDSVPNQVDPSAEKNAFPMA